MLDLEDFCNKFIHIQYYQTRTNSKQSQVTLTNTGLFFLNQKNINIGFTNQPKCDFVVELCFPSYLLIELKSTRVSPNVFNKTVACKWPAVLWCLNADFVRQLRLENPPWLQTTHRSVANSKHSQQYRLQ